MFVAYVCVYGFIKIHLSPTKWPYKRVYANILNWWTFQIPALIVVWFSVMLLLFFFYCCLPSAIDSIVLPKIQFFISHTPHHRETISLFRDNYFFHCWFWCSDSYADGVFMYAVLGMSVVSNFSYKIEH